MSAKKGNKSENVRAITLSLNEFCARLSETVRRPELISAFEYTERNAGRNRDTFAAYRERFDVFVNSPA